MKASSSDHCGIIPSFNSNGDFIYDPKDMIDRRPKRYGKKVSKKSRKFR